MKKRNFFLLLISLVILAMAVILLSYMRQDAKEQSMVLEGESNNWHGIITITYNDNHCGVNTVLIPKQKLKIDYIEHITSFDSELVGNHVNNESGEDISDWEKFGERNFTVRKVSSSWDEIQNDIKAAKIQVKWKYKDLGNEEIIIASPKNQP